MFKNTKVNDKYIKSLKNIYDNYYEKCNITTEELAKILNLNIWFINEYPDWYYINDKLYYYKDYTIFNELFLSELIKEFKLKSVKYELVKNSNMIGIISESFRNSNNKYYDYCSYFNNKRVQVPRKLINLDQTFNNILDEENKIKLMNKIYRLASFDIFCGQNDRSDGNLVFVENNNKISLAPIFDNGCAFIDKYNYDSSFDNLFMPEKSHKGIIDNYNLYLFKLINNNKVFYKYLTKALDIDVKEILKRTIEKYHLVVPFKDKRELINFFDKRKDRIEYTLTLTDKYK